LACVRLTFRCPRTFNSEAQFHAYVEIATAHFISTKALVSCTLVSALTDDTDLFIWTQIGLIDHPVTIVVDCVTYLFQTSTEATFVEKILIDQTIAIIIDLIAIFELRSDLILAHEKSIHADQRAQAAGARQIRSAGFTFGRYARRARSFTDITNPVFIFVALFWVVDRRTVVTCVPNAISIGIRLIGIWMFDTIIFRPADAVIVQVHTSAAQTPFQNQYCIGGRRALGTVPWTTPPTIRFLEF